MFGYGLEQHLDAVRGLQFLAENVQNASVYVVADSSGPSVCHVTVGVRNGAAPGPISDEVVKRVLGDEKPITGRPADLVGETVEGYREEIGDLARSEEDVISYALFPQTTRTYLERHQVGAEADVFGMHERYLATQIGAALADSSADRVREILTMVEDSEVDEVVIEEGDLKVTVRKAGAAPVAAPVEAPAASTAAAEAADASANGHHVVRSRWVATFYRAPSPQSPTFVEVGDTVKAGQTLCILEMMKMMNELTADIDGVVRDILVENGQTVEYGQPLFAIEPT